MGNIINANELASFLQLRDNSGNILIPTTNTDPSLTSLNQIIDGIEGDFDTRTNHAWGHAKTVINETHDIPLEGYEFSRGIPIHLYHYNVKPLDSASGDKVEYWDGINWNEYTDSEGMWRELPELGKIFLRGLIWTRTRENRVRMTYRYGTDTVPPDIKFAVLKKAAATVIESSFSMNALTTGSDRGVSNNQVLDRWNEEYSNCVSRWAGFTNVEY